MSALLDAPLLAGVILAWSLAAPPGPANAIIAHEASHRGLRRGVAAGLGAVAGDLTMFLLMWLGALRVLEAAPSLQVVLGMAGTLLMARFAWGAWRSAREPLGAEDVSGGLFGRTYLLIVTSPFNWAWWATAGALMFAQLGLAVVVGFFAGLVLWVLFWSMLAREGATRVPGFRIALGYAAAALLAAFTLLVAWFTLKMALQFSGAA